MSFNISAFNHDEWDRYGLQDYGDFAEMITEFDQGEDAFSGYGCWFYIPDEFHIPGGISGSDDRVIYTGSWGNDNSPGASHYTYAEIYDMNDADDARSFEERSKELESYPEFLECEDEEEFDSEEDDDMEEDEEEFDDEPTEDDITTEDHATFYQYGKVWLKLDRDLSTEEMWKAIELQMKKDNFFPSVWSISDHGNAHLMTFGK